MLFGPRRETSRIAFVRFSNTGSLSALELQRKFNQAAMGEAYGEARLRELLHHNVRPLYAEAGYMNVKFCPCETRPTRIRKACSCRFASSREKSTRSAK